MTVPIPFTELALVAHAAGGAILRDAGGYIAGTYVPAGVVQAFTAAGTALQAMGTSAVALAASNPAVTAVAVVAVVAAGTYCYFNGLPAPVAETLVHAGLASPSKNGLAVLIPKLAAALVLLGAAGYVAYRFYENFQQVWADRETVAKWENASETTARRDAERSFGADVWSTLGEAVWKTKADVAGGLANLAQQALDKVSRAAHAVSGGASAAYDAASHGSGQAVQGGRSLVEAVRSWIANIRLPFGRAN